MSSNKPAAVLKPEPQASNNSAQAIQQQNSQTGQNSNQNGNKQAEPDLTHMPQYIKKAPWYVSNNSAATQDPNMTLHQEALYHQRRATPDKESHSLHAASAKRGLSNQIITKFRKGACTNCGAMTHTVKQCIERPRKISAKVSGKSFGQDEIISQTALGYAAKRDRWNNYDPSAYVEVIDQWNTVKQIKDIQKAKALEELKRKRDVKRQEKEKKRQAGEEVSESLSDASSYDDENRSLDSDLAIGNNGHGQQMSEEFVNKDPKVRTAVRNLRQREDTAKYLRNLDLTSARYDPKARTMKENPNPQLPAQLQTFKGDNWVKHTGEAPKMIGMEGYMVNENKADEKSTLNTVGLPTQIALLRSKKEEAQKTDNNTRLKQLLGKYGGGKHLNVPEEILIRTEPEQQVKQELWEGYYG